MSRRLSLATLWFATSACASCPAGAVDTLALSCPVCHGTRVSPAALPGPYGRTPDQIEAFLWEYRSGERAGTAMPRLAASLSDAEIRRLAEHYGRVEP